MSRARLVAGIRLALLLALAGFALATPGFLSRLSLFSMLSAVSFVGCVAVGMTFITMTGNILSLALGATLSATSLVFMACMTLGVVPAMLIAAAFSAALTGAQGVVIGYLRANAILVSIAALTLIMGSAELITGGERVYPTGGDFIAFRTRFLGLPLETWVLIATVLAGQFILSATRLGRGMIMAGSNRRAAEAAGIDAPGAVISAYVLAGLCTAISGILLAARYRSGDMDLGTGYDYRAIAAVLVGGTAIQGGAGSVLRSLVGVIVIATIEMVLRLRGFSDQWQGVMTGVIVLSVVMLQAVGERR